MTQKVLMAWSGGKDSALALHELGRQPQYEVVSLLTTVTADYNRVSMHGVRRELLHHQAQALGLPLHEVFLTKDTTNDDYERAMASALTLFKQAGVASVVFGDIHLQDVRAYRENNLARADMTAVFPLWGKDAPTLATTFVDLGFKAVVACVDSRVLDRSFCGRLIDRDFLAQLLGNVDPCGENGEFHSFVFDGPAFSAPVPYSLGQVVERDSFLYCDLLPSPQVP